MSTPGIVPAESGRWVRRGDRIVLLPAADAWRGEVEGEVPDREISATEVNRRMDVEAQQALKRMAAGSAAARSDAATLLAALRAERLEGIFRDENPAVETRAKRMRTEWWQVIPQGEDAAVFLDTTLDRPPLIVYRGEARSDAKKMDAALGKAARTLDAVLPSRCGAGGPLVFAPGALPSNLSPRLIRRVGTPPPPRGVPPLCHLHVRKSPPGGTPSGGPVLMDVAGMNPGFVDAADSLVTGRLHAALNALMTGKYKSSSARIGVALVDLTGARRFNPEFAGWRSTAPVVGGSTVKIPALYALHQLRFELQAAADRLPRKTRKDLFDTVRAAWRLQGLRTGQPDLELFEVTGGLSSPMVVDLKADTRTLVDCIYAHNEGRAASLLIARIGLPYISSLLWQSGLFHPTRGGMWVTGHYGGCQHGGACCFPQQKIPALSGAVAVKPSANTTHPLTALSAATFFTLLGQGRLADDDSSNRIRETLTRACTFLGRRSTVPGRPHLPCPPVRMPAKCGIIGPNSNDAALVERKTGPGCGGRVITYAVAVTTVNLVFSTTAARRLFEPLLVDLDQLVVDNNP